jgi:hypothetical protein
MDIGHNHRVLCGDYSLYSPQGARIFTAKCAVNEPLNRRTTMAAVHKIAKNYSPAWDYGAAVNR